LKEQCERRHKDKRNHKGRGRRRSKGRVRTETVKKSSRQVIERYYSRILVAAANLCDGSVCNCVTWKKKVRARRYFITSYYVTFLSSHSPFSSYLRATKNHPCFHLISPSPSPSHKTKWGDILKSVCATVPPPNPNTC